MPTPLELLNSAPRGAVSVYSPGRRLPPAATGRSTPRRNPTAAETASAKALATRAVGQIAPSIPGAASDPFFNAVMTTPEAQAQRQQVAQQAAQKEAQANAPFWKKALGYVLAPLEPLSVPMKVVDFGLEEGVKWLPDSVEKWMEKPFGTSDNGFVKALNSIAPMLPIVGAPFGHDFEKTHDDQSWWDRIKPSSSYGAGELYGNDINVPGLTGARNLFLDISHDPLTFLTPGAGKAVELGVKAGEELNIARTALEEAPKFLDDAGKVANPAVKDLEESLAAAEKNFAKASKKGIKIKDLPHDRQGRVGMVSEFATASPENAEIVRRLAPEFQKGTDAGFQAMSQEAKDALGITKSGLRVRGTNVVIPGTGKLAEAALIPGRVGREALGQAGERLGQSGSKLLQKLGEGRTPDMLAEEFKVIRSKSSTPEQVADALFNVKAIKNAHVVENVVNGGAGIVAKQAASEIRKMPEEAKQALVREAQVPGSMNLLNQAQYDMAKVMAEAVGRPVDEIAHLDPSGYVSRINTPEWSDFYKKMTEAEKTDFRELTGMTTKDTLHTSGHLNKRMLTLDGQPAKDFIIGDRMVHVTDDSIDGLNEAFATAFPEFKGKVYETDPLKILQGYQRSLAQDSRVWSLNTLEDSARNFRMEGAIDAERQARNEALANQPREARLAETANVDRPVGESPRPVPDAPIVPGSQRDSMNRALYEQLPEMQANVSDPAQEAALADFIGTRQPPQGPPPSTGIFKHVEGDNATAALKDALLSDKAVEEQAALRNEAIATTESAQQTLGDMTKNAWGDIRKEGKDVAKKLDRVDTGLKNYRRQLEGFRSIRSNNPEEIERMIAATSKNVVDLTAELKNKTAVWRGLATKAANKAERRMQGQLEELIQIRDAAVQHLSEGVGSRVSAEVEKRTETLLAPLRQASERLAAKTAEIPARFKQGVLDAAHDTLSKAGLSDEAWQAYDQVIAARPTNEVLTTKAGRVAVDEQRTLDMAVHRAVGGEVTPYIEAQGKATALENMIPNATPEQARRMKGELAAINKEFAPGGKFFNEYKARSIMSQQLEHEQAVKAATANERASLDRVRANLETRPEATIRGPEGQRIMDESGFLDEGGRRVSKLQPGEKAGPRTERQAIEDVRAQLDPGSPAHAAEVQRTTAAVEDFEQNMPSIVGNARAEALRDIGESADLVLGPISSELKTMESITTDLGNKQQLLARRQVNDRLVAHLEKAAFDKSALPDELLRKARELQAFAKENPALNDLDRAATESLLHNEVENLAKASAKLSRANELAAAQAAARKGDLPKVFVASLHDGWVTLHGGLVQTGDMVVDAELMRRFTNVAEAVNDPKLFTRTFNNLTNLWKTWATLTPGFHVRNALGGIFMNLSDGVGFRHQLEAIDIFKQLRTGGQDWLREQPERIQQAVQAMWGSGAGGQWEEAGMRGGLGAGRLPRLSRKAGEWVEGPLRLAMGLHSFDQGDSLLASYDRIARIHFDYGAVSKMDESMKRFIPFWTFMSRNLPLQLSQMWAKPRAYAYYGSVKRNFAVPDDPLTPDYWSKLGTWNTGLKFKGMPLYLDPDFGFNRVMGDVTNVTDAIEGGNPGALLSNVNPLISAPLDFLAKRDSFYDRSFKPTDFTQQGGLTGVPLTALAHLIPGQTNEAGQVSDNFTNLISSLIPLYDRTNRLSGKSDPQRQPEAIARFLGAPVRTLSKKQQESAALSKYLDAQAERRRVNAMNREAG